MSKPFCPPFYVPVSHEARITVPFPILDLIEKDPPENSVRSFMLVRPRPLTPLSLDRVEIMSNPSPLSFIVSSRAPLSTHKRKFHIICFAVFAYIMEGFLQKPEYNYLERLRYLVLLHRDLLFNANIRINSPELPAEPVNRFDQPKIVQYTGPKVHDHSSDVFHSILASMKSIFRVKPVPLHPSPSGSGHVRC